MLCIIGGSALVIPSATMRGSSKLHAHRRCSVCASELRSAQDAAVWMQSGGDTPPAVAEVLLALFEGCAQIGASIATASCDTTSCFNDYGSLQEEIAIDLLAEQVVAIGLRCTAVADACQHLTHHRMRQVLHDQVRQTELVALATFESDKVMRQLAPEGQLSVTIDPVDASSILDTNFAVGTIFGVWNSSDLVNVTGRQLLASVRAALARLAGRQGCRMHVTRVWFPPLLCRAHAHMGLALCSPSR
mgnify:CR=1 FL=1